MSFLKPGDPITVVKLDPRNIERWRYEGNVICHSSQGILLEAYFNRPDDLPFHGINIRTGDRFIEMYFTDHWYNIFEIYDKDSDELKAWYCNITRLIKIEGTMLSYVDLALDLLVYPDGSMLELDEDEFLALDLDPAEQRQARNAFADLKDRFMKPGGVSLERDFCIVN
ncbi:MAG: DUF402 domain-containing protein [Anaerolineaceae bacterium]|nr:DUF402 domain-containing protein [Anaerolineaceae bacterium]